MILKREDIVNTLKAFFEEKAHLYHVDLAFLYGSWARGYPRIDSDVDVAVVFSPEPSSEDMVFELITDISLKLSMKIGREANIIPVYSDFRKPMLYYNAIVLGIPVFISSRNRYIALKNEAIYQMEDFCLFGTHWQMELAGKTLERIRHA